MNMGLREIVIIKSFSERRYSPATFPMGTGSSNLPSWPSLIKVPPAPEIADFAFERMASGEPENGIENLQLIEYFIK